MTPFVQAMIALSLLMAIGSAVQSVYRIVKRLRQRRKAFNAFWAGIERNEDL